MKPQLIIALIFLGFSYTLSAQSIKKDTVLMRRLDTMFKYDQFWRKEYAKVMRKEKSAYDEDSVQKNWATADSLNEIEAKKILKAYGYPGYDLVNEKGSEQFWAIAQHCDDDVAFQDRVLKLMKVQVAKNNANKENYALLVDRVLVNKHQKQIYGTQVHVDPKTHKATPLPLKYPKSVNKLRRQVGMEPLEKYLKSFE